MSRNDGTPVWLQKQYEELVAAAVGAMQSNVPPCTLDKHVFTDGWSTCRCGRVARDAEGNVIVRMTWSPPRETTLDDVSHIEPGGLTDADVRALEHPEES